MRGTKIWDFGKQTLRKLDSSLTKFHKQFGHKPHIILGLSLVLSAILLGGIYLPSSNSVARNASDKAVIPNNQKNDPSDQKQASNKTSKQPTKGQAESESRDEKTDESALVVKLERAVDRKALSQQQADLLLQKADQMTKEVAGKDVRQANEYLRTQTPALIKWAREQDIPSRYISYILRYSIDD